MPSRRASLLLVLLLLLELLPGFVFLVGTGLLAATSWSYAVFWLLVPIALAGAGLGLLLAHLKWGERDHRTAAVATGAIVAGVPSLLVARDVLTFLVSFGPPAIAFWRGLAVTAEAPSHEQVQERVAYGFGFLSFGLLWLVAGGSGGESDMWGMLAGAGIAFILVAMSALVTSRIAEARAPGAGSVIALAVLIQLGGILLVSFLGLQLFALNFAGLVGHAVQPFFDALGRDASGLLTYLAGPVDRLVGLFGLHLKSRVGLTPPRLPGNNSQRKLHGYHPPLPRLLLEIVVLLFMAAVTAGIGYVVWRAVPRTRSRRPIARPYREERHSLVSLRSLWHHLMASIRVLFRKGTDAAGDALSVTGRRIWGPAYPADPIRRMYAQVLQRASVLGVEMPSASTPLEFKERLAARWPEGVREFDLLTAAYVRRRYGDVTPDQDEVTSVRDGWQRLRHIMRGSSIVAVGLQSSRTFLAAAMTPPHHELPARPYPRDARASEWTKAERVPWRPTRITLVVLGVSLFALVIMVFLVILVIAAGRLS